MISGEEDTALAGSVEAASAGELLNLREGAALVKGKTRSSFGGQGHWPAEKNVLDGGITRRLCVFSLSKSARE